MTTLFSITDSMVFCNCTTIYYWGNDEHLNTLDRQILCFGPLQQLVDSFRRIMQVRPHGYSIGPLALLNFSSSTLLRYDLVCSSAIAALLCLSPVVADTCISFPFSST